jgi:hypothetical protein
VFGSNLIILEAEVHLGEDGIKAILGEAEGDPIEAVKVPLGEADGDPGAEVPHWVK